MRSPYQALVELPYALQERARQFARRIHEANAKARKGPHIQGWRPRGKQGIGVRTTGYLGEAAFAHWLGVPWRPTDADAFRERADVAGWDVKATEHEEGRLIVTPHDDPEGYYVLVVCACPRFYICGWYRGKDARRGEWWSAPRPGGGAWFVPRGVLRIVTGPREIEVRPAGDTPDAPQPLAPDERTAGEVGREQHTTDWRASLRALGLEPPDRRTGDDGT